MLESGVSLRISVAKTALYTDLAVGRTRVKVVCFLVIIQLQVYGGSSWMEMSGRIWR